VWLSEIMLQQTRAEAVIPYYRRFLKRFPSLRSLANAPLGDVLKQWEGLGYYARARHLHRAARAVVLEHGGRIPRTSEGLRALPGVGTYTAAAVGSLAFGLDTAVVDGNVIRVLTRLMGSQESVDRAAGRRAVEDAARALLPRGRAGEWNEAVMELGALVCTPSSPACGLCPLRPHCKAYAEGRPEGFPVRGIKKPVPHKVVGAGVIVDRRGRILIAQRRETAMLGGLWEFPGGTLEQGETLPECIRRELREELGIRVRIGERLITVHHAYSHFTIDLHAYVGRIESGRPRPLECADLAWVRLEEMDVYPFSKADLAIIAALKSRPEAVRERVPR